jgi:hypothetical protein
MLLFYLLPTVYCLLLFLVKPALSTPDGWAATYGGIKNDSANFIQQTREGGYIVAGDTKSFGAGGRDAWVLKLRRDGTVEWQKTYGGDKDDWACSIQQTRDGGYVMAGGTRSFGEGETDAWVLKLSPKGKVKWQKTYGGANKDVAGLIHQTREGGYIVGCWTESFGAGRWGSAWVLKLNPKGQVEWQKAFGGTVGGGPNLIHQTRDGGHIMAGTTGPLGPRYNDLWVIKLSADGIVEWQKGYGGKKTDAASWISQTSEGGYIVAGITDSFSVSPYYDFWVLKLGSDGTVEWQKTYGGGYWEDASSIQQTADGGYIVAGWLGEGLPNSGEPLSDPKVKFWLLKLRADGSVEWQKTYEKGDFNRLNSLQQTADGGYVMAGETSSRDKDSVDCLVFKLRADGSLDSCNKLVKETNLSGKDSNAVVKNITVYPVTTDVRPQDSSAIVQDTDASVDLFYPPTTPRP